MVYEVKLKQLKDQTYLKVFYKDTLSMHEQHLVHFKFYCHLVLAEKNQEVAYCTQDCYKSL